MKIKKTESVLTESTWKISEFIIDSESVMDCGYGEYSFSFLKENEVVHAKIPALQTNVFGNWKVKEEDGKATLFLKMENPLSQLIETWKVDDVSKKRLVLSANNKVLTFKVEE